MPPLLFISRSRVPSLSKSRGSPCARKLVQSVIMADIFVEQKDDGTYRAIQNKKTIATGNTQAQTAKRAHTKKPDDPILAERVRDTNKGSRDKWRRLYP